MAMNLDHIKTLEDAERAAYENERALFAAKDAKEQKRIDHELDELVKYVWLNIERTKPALEWICDNVLPGSRIEKLARAELEKMCEQH